MPASSGRTQRHRLSRGEDRAANNAMHRIALVRMSSHDPTRAYVQRQRDKGRSSREILRRLKRAIAREVFKYLTRTITVPAIDDLRPLRQAKKHHPAPSSPALQRLARPHLHPRKRHTTRRHPRHRLPRMAHRRLTTNRSINVICRTGRRSDEELVTEAQAGVSSPGAGMTPSEHVGPAR